MRTAATAAEDVRLHRQALEISSDLTETWRRMYRPMAAKVTPERVLSVLYEAGVRPVLMGTHGLGGWRSEARATIDVDVLVRKKDIKRAVRSLQVAYPELVVADTPVVTRFTDPAIGKVVIELMKPTQEVFRLVFRHTISAGETHDIPDLEMALVSKFAAMTSPQRVREKKLVDYGDFADVVRTNRETIDLKKLRRLATSIYPDGGAETIRLIEDLDADRPIQI